MKLSSKPLKFIILGTLILMISCGKKKLGSGYLGPYGVPPGYTAGYNCPGRIPNITFSAGRFQGIGNTTQIGDGRPGSLQPTPIGGVPSNSYVGVNLGTNDLIYITKMTAGGSVVGFNITLSLCRKDVSSGYGPPFPLFDVTRMPSVIGASPFIVSDPTNCSTGTVDQGTVVLYLPPYQVPGSNYQIPAAQTQIAFTRARCL